MALPGKNNCLKTHIFGTISSNCGKLIKKIYSSATFDRRNWRFLSSLAPRGCLEFRLIKLILSQCQMNSGSSNLIINS